ncbi:Ankyrin repeat-containing protein [Entamoeba marina]
MERVLIIQENKHKIPVSILQAAYLGDIDLIHKILLNGTSPNDHDTIASPLQIAILRQFDSIIDILLPISQLLFINQRGYAVLHTAIMANNCTVLKKCLELYPNREPPLFPDRSTCIYYAVHHRLSDVCLILIQHYFHYNLPIPSSILTETCSVGDVQTMLQLLTKITPTEEDLATSIRHGHLTTSIHLYSQHIRCEYPLHLSAESGNPKIVKWCLTKTPVDKKDQHHRTALHIALSLGHWESAYILICAGASLDISDDRGYKAIHYAVERGVKCILLLLSFHVDVFARADHGKTALHVAVECNNLEAIRAISDAAFRAGGKVAMTEFLNSKDADDLTPADIAKNLGRNDLAREIFVCGGDVDGIDDSKAFAIKTEIELQREKENPRGDEVKKIMEEALDVMKDLGIKKGLEILQSHKLVGTQPKEIATFLWNNHVDKEKAGEYLSKKDPVNQAVLKSYMKMFDFKDIEVDFALRRFLVAFKLPGESQLIQRLMEAFSEKFMNDNAGSIYFKNADAVFLLSYMIIMLNTSLYNPNIRPGERLKRDEFANRLAGQNDGGNFDKNLLDTIYSNIASDEIKMDGEETLTSARKMGWLLKEKRNVIGYTKRWAVVQDAILLLFRTSSDKTPKYIVQLDGAEIVEKDKKEVDKQPLIVSNCSLGICEKIMSIEFVTENSHELAVWIKAINSCIPKSN